MLTSVLLLLTLAATGASHPRGSTAELGELNEYLMALQWLRQDDPEAQRLFDRWLELREASWAIRTLTDEEDLEITHPRVVSQVEAARALRSAVLAEYGTFFSGELDLPRATVRLSGGVVVDWSDPVVETRVGERRLVLVEARNDGAQVADVELAGGAGRQVFVRRATLHLDPGDVRHRFVHVLPTEEGPVEGTIRLRGPGGREATLKVRALATAPAAGEELTGPRIRIRLRDGETGRPLAARVEVRDGRDWGFWGPLAGTAYAVQGTDYGWETPLWPLELGAFFYAEGEAVLGVDPEGKRLRVYRGFEYLPEEREVPADGEVEIELQRWIDMPARGWYSGHTHIHTTEIGMPIPFSHDWPIVARGEDLGVSHILTLKGEWTSHGVYADEYPMGVVPWASDEHHLIAFGQEYRNNPYGHLCFLGIHELVQPISSGALGELAGPDYPPNLFALDAALEQGGVTVGAHFGGSILDDEPLATPWPSTGFEMPADVALGRLQVAEVWGNAGQRDVWYGLLNCGFELPATAGPDWNVKDTPRTYVFLGDEPLGIDAWNEGLRLGRSFVTQGPMLFFEVEGHQSGARLHFPERRRLVRISARALLPGGSVPVEIVVNGEVVAQGTDLETTIELGESAWIAARTDDAHSNPVYVSLAGRPRGRAEDARVFIEVLDRLSDWVRRKGLFDTPEQRETVLEVIDRGRAVYDGIVARAGDDRP